ncbi:O-phosphoseryl-tRNA(Sec) selenium transferase-like [Amphibalanus amphitrite]|uniref:O-phosphoseryl-tRNA(Sec) selenium transferase-like n=1 Tax=Amphibalanus amphitrite TaxID=1232801 RepID=UPI001C9091F9|nr:O-phosphoseryl-tRNA(Sec) selenium transferase-like [Amphibalanus amphitrite]XP_043218846.1 O-phosphoseryl-tRNA(Sec) selenium transferase-like [Amphibalanus amphitrite]XP_043218847.1 O-phosphoseryl-tRNA(Sec) selenium transferase-like [Amphibalanus amphitrite]
MDAEALDAAAKLVPRAFLTTANDAQDSRAKVFRILLEQRKLPADGWSEQLIESFLGELSLMDSNNFPSNCGVGEREARLASGLVSRRHFHLGHGIGRSGDLTEPQPKAAGSSVINRLTNDLALDALRAAGLRTARACFVVPMATGMTVTLCLLTLRHSRPRARYVIWPRIDQKSCFKAIVTAGFEPIVIENELDGDELRTGIDDVQRAIVAKGAENILCVLSTTSCFAPRGIDRLEELGALCRDHSIPHVINNAYGVQSSKCMHEIQQAARTGRVDVVVQSTDKNFMVPVGGAIVAGFDKALVDSISKNYPGRASAAPSVDLLITLLALGAEGWKARLQERKRMYTELQQRMMQLAERHGERLLLTRNNPISIGMTLTGRGGDRTELTQIGSMLYTRCVSGTRVIAPGDTKVIAGHQFEGWGAHHSHYPHAYLTAAAAIGITETDVERFIGQLDKVLARWRRDRPPPAAPSPAPAATNGQSAGGASSSDGAPPREKKVVIVVGPSGRETNGAASPQPPEKNSKKSVAVTLL